MTDEASMNINNDSLIQVIKHQSFIIDEYKKRIDDCLSLIDDKNKEIKKLSEYNAKKARNVIADIIETNTLKPTTSIETDDI